MLVGWKIGKVFRYIFFFLAFCVIRMNVVSKSSDGRLVVGSNFIICDYSIFFSSYPIVLLSPICFCRAAVLAWTTRIVIVTT